MQAIQRIRKKFTNKEYEFTIPHFFEEMADDDLELSDIENAIKTGRISRKFTNEPRGTPMKLWGVLVMKEKLQSSAELKVPVNYFL